MPNQETYDVKCGTDACFTISLLRMYIFFEICAIHSRKSDIIGKSVMFSYELLYSFNQYYLFMS